MKKRIYKAMAALLPLLLLIGGARAVIAQEEAKPEQSIKLQADLVSLNVLATNRKGEAVPHLAKGDFAIYEDGVEQQLSFFSDDKAPVSWGLILDRSGSMADMMEQVYNAGIHVIDRGTSDDEMFIITFNQSPQLLIDFTADRHNLQMSVTGVFADGMTAIWDAVAAGLDRMRTAKYRKKVLVVVTDGEDNSSATKLSALIQRAEESDVLIYTVGMFDTPLMGRLFSGANQYSKPLQALATATGGSAHFPKNVRECEKSMVEISREVSEQYGLGYYPSNTARDGTWRKVRVVIRKDLNAEKYLARTRRGYYAAAQQNSSQYPEESPGFDRTGNW